MGLKHEARMIAVGAGLSVVPGSEGLVDEMEDAARVAHTIGYPVMIKATAGGGGMGLVVCRNEEELGRMFPSTRDRARMLFGHAGLFIERYLPAARHIEVQVFGDGYGNSIHMGERECSVQRRHQKVIEEAPSVFLRDHPDVKETMCAAAVRLCKSLKYGSAGTVEFIVDEETAEFFFLEMNTRIQVEHGVTEALHPGLDIVWLMLIHATAGDMPLDLESSAVNPGRPIEGHALEARVYAERPGEGFRPAPGILQHVSLGDTKDWLRIDGWVSTGTTVTPFFDPLLFKVIVTGSTRNEAIDRMILALKECDICGPGENLEYLLAICRDGEFRDGHTTTSFLDHFAFTPRAISVISGGVETTVQELPGRVIGRGIPHSGPMDVRAFSAANVLVGNHSETAALEVVAVPGAELKILFQVAAVIAVTGSTSGVKVNGKDEMLWTRLVVPENGLMVLGGRTEAGPAQGMRAYLAIRGGFPKVAQYLGSKSTSMGLGGYQGRALRAGDALALGECAPTRDEIDGIVPDASRRVSIPPSLIPSYPRKWTIHVLSGPHDDPEFITSEGTDAFYSTLWCVSISSNRMGIRLECPQARILWARNHGGEGGSHPSNILDCAYARGSVNINGDTPVILGNEGPDMGGYVCLCTIASAEMWKLGQLAPGCTVQFKRISWEDAVGLTRSSVSWLEELKAYAVAHVSSQRPADSASLDLNLHNTPHSDAKLYVIPPTEGEYPRPGVVFRQAGDSAILAEFGDMILDFALRARVHALESVVYGRNISGLVSLAPCIRSTMCYYDPTVISQHDMLAVLVDVAHALPDSTNEMRFIGRRITFPIVLNDRWNRQALSRYMQTIRDKAVYLPSNIEYLARNNGLGGGAEEALSKLVSCNWVVFGVGFYLACPFLVPIDPRCRLVGQKMNPSRTFTPRGAVGIAGLVAAIYPVESPGGYQLYGRTLPAWQTWGNGQEFSTQKPWLLDPFDQITFKVIDEEEYLKIEREFDAGRYAFQVEQIVFSMSEHVEFVKSIADEVAQFLERRTDAVAHEEAREHELLKEWTCERQNRTAHDPNRVTGGSDAQGIDHTSASTTTVVAPISASIWKIACAPGSVVQTADEVLLILEAMKTEIGVAAGEGNVGRTVRGLGKGVFEGASVSSGDTLIFLD